MNPVFDWPLLEHWQNQIGGKYYELAYDDQVEATSPYTDGEQLTLDLTSDYGPSGLN